MSRQEMAAELGRWAGRTVAERSGHVGDGYVHFHARVPVLSVPADEEVE